AMGVSPGQQIVGSQFSLVLRLINVKPNRNRRPIKLWDRDRTVSNDAPIAILDSGLGGLTVVRYLRAQLPHERIIYFGDTARTPYGLKSAATVTGFVRQIVNFLRL